jgi:hypothetical protein
MTIAAFLSYSHHDKELAGRIKTRLERFGFDGFLAHEDIAPSEDWEKEILRQLQACDVFVAVLTDYFDESDWTHQEIGIAYGRGPIMPIMVPVSVDSKPVGFFKRFQAVSLDPEDLEDACRKIAKSVADKNEKLGVEIRSALIGSLESADSFDQAGTRASRLRHLGGLSADEANRLLRVAATNPQVYGSGSASPHLRELIRRHKKEIKPSVLSRFRKVWAYK